MNSEVKNISRTLLLVLISLMILKLPANAQRKLNDLTKHFTRKENVARTCHDVEVANNGLVMVATGYGINFFNGYAWDIRLGDKLKSPRFTKLKRDQKKSDKYYVGGLNKIGFFVLRNDQFQFKEIISFKENKEKLGGRLLKIYQKGDLIFFLGSSSGCIVYNQQTRQKNYITPINNITSFSTLRINQDILIISSTGDVFKLADNQWVKLVESPTLIQKYQPIFLKEFENNLSVLISNEKKFYLKTGASDIREVSHISALIKNGVKFQVKKRKNYLVISTNKMLFKFHLDSELISCQQNLSQVVINNFSFDLQGNVWVTTNNGAFYIELNEKFTFHPNDKGVRKCKLLGKYEVNLLKSENTITINNGKKTQAITFDGLVSDVALDDNRFLVSTSKGLYEIDAIGSLRKKILNGEFRRVVSHKPKQIFLLAGTQTLQVLNKEYDVINTINLTGGGIYNTFISTDGIIYYSTSSEVYQIQLSPDFKSTLSQKKIVFPSKTRFSFIFFEEDNSVYIVNALGLFKVDNHKKITCLTANLKGLPRDQEGIYYQKFSFAKPLSKDCFFLASVYSKGNGAESFPGILSKDQSGQYTFANRDFKRIGKIVTTDVKKLDSSHVQIIAQKKIITCNLNIINISVDKFNSYIREVTLKKDISDSVKNDLTESNYQDLKIYQGITQQHKIANIPYETNSITIKFASDYYIVTEANKYSYKLKGLEKSWSNWTSDQEKEYTHLREGTYTFQVRCKNVYGTISSVASYTFTILPPWYRTWWAYALYILAVISLLVGGSISYSHYRTRQIRQYNEELEQVVERRTEEIRIQQKELKNTNEELIKANTLIKKDRDEKVKIYLQEATEAASKLKQIQETLTQRGPEIAQKLLTNEINTAGELSIIQEKVRGEFPDFASEIDKALTDKKITKVIWQVGYCLKLGRSPIEIAKIRPLSNRTVSAYGTKLRKLGILEAVNK